MNQPLFQEESQPEENLEQASSGAPNAAGIAPPPAAVAQRASASGVGATLLSLREARGLSRGEVSGRLKFSSRQIEALETEQWDILPHGVPLRGFVKNYARFLEADVDALLVMLDRQVGATTPREAAVSSAASLGNTDVPLHVESSSRPWGWLVIILVLVFVAVFYALERGWVPDSWLVFDWLKALKK